VIRSARSAAAITAALWLCACGDGDLPMSRYEKVDVNVELTTPSEEVVQLGAVHGANACGALAWSYAADHHFEKSDKWGYVCCTIEHGDQCRHKIR
jgi:hypothetical protein